MLVSLLRIGDNPGMSSVVHVAIHASQFPDAVRRDLLESLRRRQVNHKFHYDSIKQTQQWLALHAVYAPSRTDTECERLYDHSFANAAARLTAAQVHVIGLGCGGGRKDTRLLTLLREAGKEVFYTPCDVSSAMVLVARETALATVPEVKCSPLVCDLAKAEDLAEALAKIGPPAAARVVTFFGMIPNFEPGAILPKLSRLLGREDGLLFSANLAPGADYAAGLRFILPQYDNGLTRDWLFTFLLNLGVEQGDGELQFSIEDDPAGSGLKRIVAQFHFARSRVVSVEGERFEFSVGDRIRLFFSYRYTPARVCELLARYGLSVAAEWILRSGEEGVFEVRRT